MNTHGSYASLDATIRPISIENGISDLMYDNIPVGVVICDSKGRIIRMNQRNCEIFGVQNPKLVYGFSLFDDEMISTTHREQMRLNDDYTYTYELDTSYLNTRGKSTFQGKKQLLCRFRKIYDKNRVHKGYVLVNVDMTSSQQDLRNEAISLSRQLQLIHAAANMMSWRYDVLSGRLFVNYSNAPTEFLNKTDVLKQLTLSEFVRNLHPDDHPIFMEKFASVIRRHTDVLEMELRYNFYENNENYIWASMAGIVSEVDKDNKVLLLLGSTRIIEPQKRMEAELREAKEKAEASDRLKTTFIEQTNHEIRTPLNAIVGYADVLTSCHDVLDEKSKQELVEGIHQNSDKMLTMVNSILYLSQLNTGTLQKEVRECSLHDLCNSLYHKFIPYSSVEVELKMDANGNDSLVLHTDSKLLTIILSNLMDNAFKFTKKGSVTLSYKKVEKGVEFCVSDTGPGLPSMGTHVFDLFSKGDRFIPGMGLGLPLCHGLVQFLGGSISCESQEGVGAKFIFVLPEIS